jgi:hypothetical protein
VSQASPSAPDVGDATRAAAVAAGVPARGRGVELLDRIGRIGSAAQASVPGLYAWGVTVLPAVFAHGVRVHWAAKVLAVAGAVSLAVAVAMERRWGPRARYVAVWGLSLTSGLAWLIVPASTLGSMRLDWARGVAGMLGWALFAFSCAAPALPRDPASAKRLVDEAPLRPRAQIKKGDAAYIAAATVAVVALQLVGWRVATPERALLVRLVTVAAGLGLLGTATTISLARHGRTFAAPLPLRFRRALPWLLGLTMVGLAGAVLMLRA